MVEVQDVRDALNNIAPELIPSNTIYRHITTATFEAEYDAPTNAPTQLIEEYILKKATYLSYLGYVLQMERSVDASPTPQMRTALDLLRAEVDKAIERLLRECSSIS